MTLEKSFLLQCEELENEVRSKLGRPLNIAELKGIHNACGGQMLEVVSMAVYSDLDPKKLSKYCIDAGTAFDVRLAEFRLIAEKHTSTLLGRALSTEEISRLAENDYWTDYLKLFIQISEMPKKSRFIPD